MVLSTADVMVREIVHSWIVIVIRYIVRYQVRVMTHGFIYSPDGGVVLIDIHSPEDLLVYGLVRSSIVIAINIIVCYPDDVIVSNYLILVRNFNICFSYAPSLIQVVGFPEYLPR